MPSRVEELEATAGRLEAEIADLSRQLAALPLEKSNRDVRLKLNDLKRAREVELVEALRAEKRERLRLRLVEIDAELRSLAKGPATREHRQRLLEEQRQARKELELADRGEAP